MNHETRKPPGVPLTRRDFSRSAAGTLVALGSVPALLQACASLPTARSLPPVPGPDAARRAELNATELKAWRDIDHLARLAPTPHNTQPFRIRPLDGATAEIVAVPERFLPEEDHGNLYVTSAFGIFAAAMELAGRAIGKHVTVVPEESINVAQLHLAQGTPVLGKATIVGNVEPSRDAAILDARRTSRIPYHDQLVEAEIWKSLEDGVASHGQTLLEYHDPELVDLVLHLNANAIIDNLALTRERKEIQHWYRTGPTPEFGDGLWEIPLNQKAFEIRTAFGSPRAYRLPIIRPLAVREYLKTQRGTRHIALLHGPFSTWPELVNAGRALFELWTEMARHGVYVQPMGSMLTNANYAAKVAEQFKVNDCWLIMRAGLSNVPPKAPRLESVLI